VINVSNNSKISNLGWVAVLKDFFDFLLGGEVSEAGHAQLLAVQAGHEAGSDCRANWETSLRLEKSGRCFS
jgi:hypothetical protein